MYNYVKIGVSFLLT